MRNPNLKDLAWFRPDGKEMTQEDWSDPFSRCLGMVLAGDVINEFDDRGNSIIDDTLLILINAHWEPISFVMPPSRMDEKWDSFKGEWVLEFDTAAPDPTNSLKIKSGKKYDLQSRTLAVFVLESHAP